MFRGTEKEITRKIHPDDSCESCDEIRAGSSAGKPEEAPIHEINLLTQRYLLIFPHGSNRMDGVSFDETFSSSRHLSRYYFPSPIFEGEANEKRGKMGRKSSSDGGNLTSANIDGRTRRLDTQRKIFLSP